MFREIFKALKRKDSLSEMVEQLGWMIDNGRWMFERAATALMHEIDWSALAEEMYARDRKLNAAEQKIREHIIIHLSLGNQSDLNACLILMSVVKDAERIGDYDKNIFEIAKFYRRGFAHPEYSVALGEIRSGVLPLFDRARKAFTEGDRDLANAVLDEAHEVRKRCDEVIRRLLGVQEAMAPDEAVAYVLCARFCKRVAAHLANIATSVVCPVPMIDYHGTMPKEGELS